MLTIRENLLETIKGGNPDRFVKQYEFLEIIDKVPIKRIKPKPGEEIKNEWGITFKWPKGQLGDFPVHDEEHIVLKDVREWKKYVKAPSVIFSEEEWQVAVKHAESVNRKEKFVTGFVAPGLFEMTHHLMRMENALMNYYEEPEKMHELLDYLMEYELKYAEQLIKYLKPDAIFHHDDWGSQTSTFISPKMFEEFFVPRYKKIYKYYKDNGVELIVHHCDSYAATLVPYMIEMGIDIWQGTMSTNNTPELIDKYGGQISFMGDIDSGVVDFPDWTPENTAKYVEESCRRCGKLYYIPCVTHGLAISYHEGVYENVNEEIDRMSKIMF
ncbi:hypothetical protein K8M07_05965 [Schnuerera sp. xch1]|uniref:uroporphyrinogen decarboxylase family protein n=1 Tax=Schnuerera sp. xch1 TaxID=2874283 RepID=UPI001CBC90A4|nr:uroporphyrinogen decarboxylase family protein [Schnuerera sp. xch1]MBZ2174792.1 hypothetical protein [Schnuerera sp. xch1]